VGLDAASARLRAKAAGHPARPSPTFSLALAALPDPHWSAVAPNAPLRHWRLLEIGSQPGTPLTLGQLRIDERILHFLAGVQHLDERLSGLIEPIPHAPSLAP